jgi:hypothetical protein
MRWTWAEGDNAPHALPACGLHPFAIAAIAPSRSSGADAADPLNGHDFHALLSPSLYRTLPMVGG